MRAAPDSISNGFSQESEGSIESAGASFARTRAMAQPANKSRAPIWATIITFCTRADSSVPITQIAVITMMIATARPMTAAFDSAAESQPKSR